MTALNQRFMSLKTKLRRFCDNNLFDNTDVINYIKNDRNYDDFGNSLNAMLSLDLDFFDDDKAMLKKFIYEFNIIKQANNEIITSIETATDGIENYKGKKNELFLNITKPTNMAPITTVSTDNNNNDEFKILKNNITHLSKYIDVGVFSEVSTITGEDSNEKLKIDFSQISIKDYVIGSTTSSNLKNHIYMMLLFRSPNELSQLKALEKLFEMIEKFIKLYVFSKCLKEYGQDDGTLCTYFNNIREEFDDSLIIDITGSVDSRNYNNVGYDHEDKQITITKNRSSDASDIDYLQKVDTSYLVEYENKQYEIKDFQNDESGQVDNVYTITLYDKLKNPLNNSDVTNSPIYISLMKSNNQNNFKKRFLDTGKELRSMNSNILDSRNKINSLYEKSNGQKEILNSLDTYLIIYYVCIAVITAIYIALVFITKKDIQQYGTIGAFIIAFAMNISNNFLSRGAIIEKFTTEIQCEDVDTVRKKLDFIKQKIEVYMDYFDIYLDNVQQELNHDDVTNVFQQVYGSLENEKKAFKEHEKNYKYKVKMGKQGIDIIKQDIVERIAYMYLISSCTLIVTIVFLFYLLAPEYINIYIGIAALIILYILIVYYYKVIQIVNTKTSNKYWGNISEETMEKL